MCLFNMVLKCSGEIIIRVSKKASKYLFMKFLGIPGFNKKVKTEL